MSDTETTKNSIAEKIRLYFAQTKPNMNTSTSSSEDELDYSFRKMLSTHKPISMSKNKENISPSTAATSMQNDLSSEDNESYYDDDDDDDELDTPENEEELEAMKRLLNNIRSPVKMIELLRPSTIFEEPSISSNNSSTSAHTNSFFTAQNQTASTIDENMSKDSLMISGRSVNHQTIDGDSLAVIVQHKDQFNETLEEMEYVKDNSKYLLKPVNKVVTPSRKLMLSPRSEDENNVEELKSSISNNNVILIESSPESSFETATDAKKHYYRDECLDVGGASVKMEKFCESITISDDDEPIAAANLSKQGCNADGTLDGISSLDDSTTNQTENEIDSAIDTNNSSNPLEREDDPFNDTIERFDYMMKKGQELLASGKIDVVSPSPSKKPFEFASPKTVIKTTPTKSPFPSVILKQRNTNSPSSTGKMFKKPDSMFITPGVLKKPPIHHHTDSKIPRPKMQPTNRKLLPTAGKFNHIISPVGQYINKMAPSPMQTECKQSNRDFFDTTISNEAAKNLDFSVASNSSFAVTPNYVPRLPKKAYISASKRYLTDETTTKVPGGQKIHKVIGPPVTIIRHEGLIDMNIDRNSTIDESIADLSLMPGDVSVQIKRDVKHLY